MKFGYTFLFNIVYINIILPEQYATNRRLNILKITDFILETVSWFIGLKISGARGKIRLFLHD